MWNLLVGEFCAHEQWGCSSTLACKSMLLLLSLRLMQMIMCADPPGTWSAYTTRLPLWQVDG